MAVLDSGNQIGAIASAVVNDTGCRYLDRRKTAHAPGFATLDAGLGYRRRRIELTVNGRNLGDRDPVPEGELGNAQDDRIPARGFDIALRTHF